MKSNSDLFELSSNYAKDIKSKASNLLRRRHTDASFTDKSILPSREDIYKWQTSFEHLLRHKYGIALFRGFLKTEFSDENIEFWLECEEYKYTKDIKRQTKSKKIYSDYVAVGSPREVNLDIEIRAHTAQNILNPSYDTFERAQKRIQALMEKDSYPRFLESDLYKNLLASYPPLPTTPSALTTSPPATPLSASVSQQSVIKATSESSASAVVSSKTMTTTTTTVTCSKSVTATTSAPAASASSFSAPSTSASAICFSTASSSSSTSSTPSSPISTNKDASSPPPPTTTTATVASSSSPTSSSPPSSSSSSSSTASSTATSHSTSNNSQSVVATLATNMAKISTNETSSTSPTATSKPK